MNDNKFPQMDWQQVVLNGGPPCFHAEGPQFCGRAERWPGHGNPAFHDFVSLQRFLTKAIADERERCARICDNAESPDYEHGLMANGWEDAKVHLSQAVRRDDTADAQTESGK